MPVINKKSFSKVIVNGKIIGVIKGFSYSSEYGFDVSIIKIGLDPSLLLGSKYGKNVIINTGE